VAENDASNKNSVPVINTPQEKKKSPGFLFNISERFAILNKLITRDLNKTVRSPRFVKYTKDNIIAYLKDPYRYQKQIADAITYIYGASSHFARLIQYFTGLTNLAYVVVPYRIDPFKENKKTIRNNYRRVLNLLSIANIKTQCPIIIKTCFLYDTFNGYFWETSDSVTIQQLPNEYCAISSIEGNVFNISFNFSYFDIYKELLDFYPEEFHTKYNEYKKTGVKWIELSSPNGFAIKFNKHITDYSLPPFAGLLREIYDLEDYKDLKLTKTELENYALIDMKLPMNSEGEWLLDSDKAIDFFNNLSAVLPEEVGAVLTPMDLNKTSFERTSANDADTISEAEDNLFTAAGVSSLLFNNPRASATALLMSIKADQSLTYSLVQSIEDVFNRFIWAHGFGKKFKVNFLDISPFNEKDKADEYLKACQYGVPMISHYSASLGVGQSEMEGLNFLEVDVLDLPGRFVQLQNSAHTSSNQSDSSGEIVEGTTEVGGRPPVNDTELTDSGEQSREDSDDWG